MAGSYWDRFAAQRVTRRRVLQGAGAAGAAAGAVWLVGCGGGDDGAQKPANGDATGKPVRGGRYQVATSVDFDTFDPHISIAGGVAYFPRLYNVLVNYSAVNTDFEFLDLAESFEHPDDLTYIYKIRPGVKIAPNTLGVPERDLDAMDAKTSFDRIKTLPQSNAYAFVGQWIESGEASADNKIYTIKTPKPYAFFRNRIGSPINTIGPRELIVDAPDKLKDAAIGGGPYSLRSYTEGQTASLDRNPNYYRKDSAHNNEQLPYLDGLDVRIVADRAAIRAAFQSRQVYQYTAENVDEAKQLQQGTNYTLVNDPVFTFIAFTMNPTKDPWKDDRVRKAAMHAINRQDYIDRVYKGEAQANGLIHWPIADLALSNDELETLQGYDPQKSRALIKEATGQDTVKIKVMWPANSIIEEHSLHLPIWLEQMKAAGFDIESDPQPFATWLGNYTNLQYDASLALNQVYEYAEFNLDWQHSEGPARNNIYAIGLGKLYPAVDKKIDELKTITDPEKFRAEVKAWQRDVYDKGPTFLPIVSPKSFTLYQPFVKNIPQGLGTSGLFVNSAWLEL